MCDGGFAKKLLLLFNIIFWIGGVVLLGFGIWMKVDPNIVHYLAVVNVSGNMHLLNFSAWIFIIIGIFVLLIGVLGCLGALRSSQSLLFIYAVLVLVVMVVEIAGGILALVYRMKLEGNLNASMTHQIKTEYIPGSATYDAWNYIQMKLSCCGATNFTDYMGSVWWNSTRNSTAYVPASCCDLDKLSKCQMEASQQSGNLTFMSLHGKGCSEAVTGWFEMHTLIMMILGFVIGGCQIFAFITACLLRNALKTDQYSTQKIA